MSLESPNIYQSWQSLDGLTGIELQVITKLETPIYRCNWIAEKHATKVKSGSKVQLNMFSYISRKKYFPNKRQRESLLQRYSGVVA